MDKKIEFQLRAGEDFIPLIQLLKVAQVASSGGESQSLVINGAVMLNGQKEFRKRAKIKAGDVVAVMGFEIFVKAAE